MAVELAAAYVSLVPSLKGAAGTIQKELSGVDVSGAGSALGKNLGSGLSKSLGESVSGVLNNLGSGLQSTGKKISSVGSSLTKGITAPVVGAAGAVTGLVGALGFKRLVGIDTARGQFKGLGLDANAVMKEVDKGVTDTSLSMAQGASMAVGILATGAVPLKDLESQIKRVANVSAAYNVESEQAAYLLNNVLTKNKVTWGDLSQMQMNQIPIVTMLAEHYGVAGDEIMKMAQDGKISIEDLNTVLDDNAGAAALEYAKTWRGVTSNIMSNLGKIGAKIMEPTFEIVKEKAADLLEVLRSPDFSAWAERAGLAIAGLVELIVSGDFSGKLREALGWEEDDVLVGRIQRVRDAIVGLFDIIVNGNFSEELRNAFNIEEDSPIVGLLEKVHDNLLPIVGTALAAGPALLGLGKAFTVLGGAIKVVSAIIGMSPFGWLAIAIAAAVAGLAYFFTQTETGQEIWSNAWGKIKDAAAAVKDWFVNTALPALTKVWDNIKEAASAAADWFNEHVVPVFESAGELLSEIWPRVQEKFSEAWDKMKSIWDVVGQPLIDTVTAIFEDAWNTMKTVVETALGVIKGIIDAVTAALRGDWDAFWEAIKGILSTVWDGITGVIESKMNLAKDLIKSALELIRNWWNAAWDDVKAKLSAAWDSIKTTVTTKVGEVVDLIRSLPGKAKDALSNIGSTLLQAGKNLIQGLIDGIQAKFQAVRDKLSSLTNLLPDWKGPADKDAVLLRSAGELVIAGFVDGMESRYGRVHSSLEGLSHDIAGTRFGSPNASLARTDQMPERMEIAGTLDLGDGMTAALRGVADFTQMGGLRSRMAAGVRS